MGDWTLKEAKIEGLKLPVGRETSRFLMGGGRTTDFLSWAYLADENTSFSFRYVVDKETKTIYVDPNPIGGD